MKSPRLSPLRAALCLSLLALVALIAGCGGGSSSSAKDTVKKAFSHSIKSAVVNLQFSANVSGVASLQQKPVSLKLSGPYQSNGKGKLPNLNWQVGVSGGGQSFSGGLISTGDNAFVSFQGTNYEVGKAQVAAANQRLGGQTQGKTLKDFGIDPANWITNAQDKGSENVNGVDTDHVQAGLAIDKMLTDLNKTISAAGTATGTQQLTPQQIAQVKDVVKSPKFDVYVAKSDNTLRRLNVVVNFQIPASQKSQFRGATGGSINFSLDLTDVGKPQTVTAPPNPKPISQLQGALGALGGASGSTGSGSAGPSGASGSSGKSPSSTQVQAYTTCIEKANPGDAAAIQKCTQLLSK